MLGTPRHGQPPTRHLDGCLFLARMLFRTHAGSHNHGFRSLIIPQFSTVVSGPG